MHLDALHALIMLLCGAVTGVLGAILGTGGGVFLVPILVLALGVPMHQAVATSILSVVATSSAVASANVERGLANMRLGMTLEVGTSLGAIAGGLVAGWLSHRALVGLFAAVLVPTAVLMWRGRAAGRSTEPLAPGEPLGALGARYFDESAERDVAYRVRRLWAGLIASVVAGGLSGLLGIGGGVFKVPALHLLCGVPMKAAAATSNFMIGVTAAASALLYFGRGDVPLALAATSVLGVLGGSAVGTLLNRQVPDVTVRKVFAALLLVVSVQMVYHACVAGG
jgi:uncharacterized membrane protein YfcA